MMDKETIKRALLSVAILVMVPLLLYVLRDYFVQIWVVGIGFSYSVVAIWLSWAIAGGILSHPWVSGGRENGKETV